MRFKVCFLLTVFFSLVGGAAFAQSNNFWQKIDEAQINRREALTRRFVPRFYQTFRADFAALRDGLRRAPAESFGGAKQNANDFVVEIPMPDGKFQRFRTVETKILAPELARAFPDFRTYAGQGIDDPTATARFDLTINGFRAMIFSAVGGTSLVEPYADNNTEYYISFYKRDAERTGTFECHTNDQGLFDSDYNRLEFAPDSPTVTNGTVLRVYRLALAATGEYTNVFRQAGDTDAQAKTRALAAMTTSMNRVNGVYERDLAVRMTLSAGTPADPTALIYTDPNTDPYTNSNGVTMLSQNQSNLDSVVGDANYDIGHVFSTGGGGVATLRVPCASGSKARGVTGSPNPQGDAYDIDYVAHEMGHQFGANHTFNGTVGSCGGGNRSGSAAYEPGSGITIMAYAGICGNQNLAAHSIDTFHVKSLEEIVNFISNSGTCSVNTPTGNAAPTVTASGTTFIIPKNTPFYLSATGTDPNGDTITYDWQEYDLGASTTTVPNTDADGNARPIFRPYLPNTMGIRYFPSLQYVLNNSNTPPPTFGGFLTGELLPQISRTMSFQVVARDGRANGGAINTATVQVVVDASNSTPFAVTAPNGGETWSGTRTVTWDTAGTNAAPVNAANVKISLSTDGGQTFPIVLAASTPNDGSENVTLPSINAASARIKIEAVGNVFFDISNANFSIAPSTPAASPVSFDFDGDGRADIAVFRPANGFWYLQRSQQGFLAYQFGLAQTGANADKPVAGDFDGDGRADIAIFRPTNGTWYRINSSNNTFAAVQFGQNGDVPVLGDFDGDRKTDIAVFRPTNGTWYRLNSADNLFYAIQFGQNGDVPTAGDFDGDGRADVAVFRPTDGTWYRLNSSNNSSSAIRFGTSNDIPTAADFDGDGRADIAVYRSATGDWFRINSGNGQFVAYRFGTSEDIPVPADYDGDRRADIAVFRPSEGTWYLQQSANGFAAVRFGTSGDTPISASVIR
jgi:hypothetical protein